MRTVKIFSTLILVGLMASLSGCLDDGNQFVSPAVKKFDINLFKTKVDAFMQGNATGYCYVIAQDGQVAFSAEEGKRIAGADGSVNQDIHSPMYAASVSKAITAVAALRLMEDKGISINEKVWKYLPSYWNIASSFKQISFKNLMQHKSGIDKDTGYDFLSLKELAATGVNVSDVGSTSEYANANFGLFRILIPYMIADQDELFNSPEISLDDGLALITANVYKQYVKETLFIPLNISSADTKPAANATLYYTYPTGNSQQGWSIGDRTLLAGGGGWYISCYDLAKLFAYVRFTDNIISGTSRDLMNDNFLGWDKGLSVSNNFEHGTYHAKNGGFTNANGQGVSTLVKNFPEGVQISVMVNSKGGDYDEMSINSGVAKAFDDAWVIQN